MNGTTLGLGGSYTVTAASSSLLSDNNKFTGNDIFTNASSTLFSVSGSTWLGNATSTNFFSTTASSTNLFAQTAAIGSLTLGVGTTSAGNGINIASGCFAIGGTCLNNVGFGANTWTGLQTFSNGSISNSSSTNVGAFTVTGAVGLGSTLSVAGNTTLANASTTLLSVSGASWFSGLATFSNGYIDNASSTHTAFTTFTTASSTAFTAGSKSLPPDPHTLAAIPGEAPVIDSTDALSAATSTPLDISPAFPTIPARHSRLDCNPKTMRSHKTHDGYRETPSVPAFLEERILLCHFVARTTGNNKHPEEKDNGQAANFLLILNTSQGLSPLPSPVLFLQRNFKFCSTLFVNNYDFARINLFQDVSLDFQRITGFVLYTIYNCQIFIADR